MEPESHVHTELNEEVPTDDSPTGWFNLGCTLANKGKPTEAERALKIAIDMKQDYAIAWAILSAILLSQGHETDAEKAGKMALSMCKDLKMTWPKLRSIMFNDAIQKGKDWKSPRSIRFESSSASEWGTVLSKLGDSSKEAIDQIEPTHEVSMLETEASEPDALVELEEDMEKKDDSRITRRAFPVVHEAHASDNKAAEAWFSEARVYMNAGSFDKAETALKRGLMIDPKNAEALLRVGTLMMRKKIYDKAEDSLRLAVEYDPENSEAWLQLGISQQALGKWTESADALKIASDKNPQNLEIWVKLGEADYNRSLYQEAAKSFLRVLRIDSNHKVALFYLGRCMEYRGNESHALRVYNKLLSLNPEDPEILEELAKSFHRLGSVDASQRAKSLASYRRRAKP